MTHKTHHSTGDRPTKADIGAATRADLLAAGRKLFARRGFDGTSVRAITSAAGANLGAVTYHFGSKRALYSAVLEQGLRPIAERVRLAAGSEGSGLDRMLRVVEAYFDHFQKNPDLPHLLLQEVAAGKKPPAIVVEIVRGVKETIAGLQQEGVADGSVRPWHPVLTALERDLPADLPRAGRAPASSRRSLRPVGPRVPTDGARPHPRLRPSGPRARQELAR